MWIVPARESVFVSPAARCPTSQVNSPAPISAPPVAVMSNCEGMSLVTITSVRETPDTFSTSSSISSGPPSPPFDTVRERASLRSGLVSNFSRRTSILLFFTLYLVENSLRDSSSSTCTWSPARLVLTVLFNITSIS